MEKPELKVLLIEDNPGDAFLIKFYLGESMSPKFDFHLAETIKGAYEALEANTFDIILMDLNLPDSVGLDTIKKLLEKYPNNLVIVLTGLVDEKTGLETVRFGAQDFLVKGKFDGKVLISSIMFAFERFNLNKELSSVSSKLNKGKERFENLEILLNAGYVEANLTTRELYISPQLHKLLNLPQKQYTIDELLPCIENREVVKTQIATVWNQEGIKEITMHLNIYAAGPLKFKWRMTADNLVIGAVFPA